MVTKTNRIAVLCAALLVGTAGVAAAQDAPSPKDQERQDQEKIETAKALHDEGKKAQEAKDWDAAIAAYEAAFEAYPDPGLQILIGEMHREKGNATGDFDLYKKAIEYYETYLTLAPDGPDAEGAKQLIATLKEGIEREEERVQKEKAEEEKKVEAQRKKEEEAEKRRLAELEKRQGMQIAADGMVLTGLASDLTAIPRGFGGAMLNWGKLGIEAHLGFDFFFRLDGDGGGFAARSLSLDLGGRIGFRDDRFTGPFVAAGTAFGVMLGSPRERRLEDDTETCMAQVNQPDCSFDVDKTISTRLGLGWGFEAGKETTVAIRVDGGYWLFSVDGDQSVGSPPARFVDRPQSVFSVMVGLEFMRWL